MRTMQRIGLAISSAALITGATACAAGSVTEAPAAGPTQSPGSYRSEPNAPAGPSAKLDGSYTVHWRLSELAKALGGRWEDASENVGELTVTIHGTDFWFNGICHGKSEITDDRIIVTTTAHPSEWDCGAGRGAPMINARWRIDGDLLRLTDWRVTGSGPGSLDWNLWIILGFKPLHKVS